MFLITNTISNRINGFDNLINSSTEKKLVLNELDQLISYITKQWSKTNLFFYTYFQGV